MDNQLTSVTIPDSITYIGGAAFILNQLSNVVIPNNDAYVSERAFDVDVTVKRY